MKLTTLFAMACFMFAVPITSATTISATLNSINPTSTTQGTYTGDSYTAINSGALTFTSPTVGSFIAFCVEPEETINLGESVTYTLTTLTRTDLAQIMAVYYASPQDALNAQGAQWAMWELLQDHSVNLSKGDVKLPNGAVKDKANEYLDMYEDFAPASNAVWLSSSNRQDMIACIPEPQPAAMLLGAFGIITLLRRRK
jgi:hypothetical protein